MDSLGEKQMMVASTEWDCGVSALLCTIRNSFRFPINTAFT